MQDGFYAVYYTGQHGSGVILLCIKQGRTIGVDPVGGKISGTFSLGEGFFAANLVFELPQGGLVTGQVLDQPVRVERQLQLPLNFFQGEVAMVDIGFGKVNARAEFLSDAL